MKEIEARIPKKIEFKLDNFGDCSMNCGFCNYTDREDVHKCVVINSCLSEVKAILQELKK